MNPPNIEAVTKSNPRFWRQKRLKVLREILAVWPKNSVLTPTILEEITGRLRGHRRKLPRSEEHRLHSVISELARLALVESQVSAPRPSAWRPSILPHSTEQFAEVGTLPRLYDFAWRTWIANQRHASSRMLLVAMSLAIDGGFSDPLLTSLVASTTWNQVVDGRVVMAPVHPDDASDRLCPLTLPASTRFLIYLLRNETCTSTKPDANIFMPHITGDRRARILAAEKEFEAAYAQLCNAYVAATGPSKLPSWKTVVHHGRLLAYTQGMAPYILTLQSSFPLPTAHPESSELPLLAANVQSPASLHRRMARNVSSLSGVRTIESETKSLGTDRRRVRLRASAWRRDSGRVISRLLSTLKEISDSRFTTPRLQAAALAAVHAASAEADELAPKSSALHLAILWVAHRLQNTSAAVSFETLRTEISRAFTAGFLRDSDSFELLSWEPEDHQAFVEEYLSRDDLNAATKLRVAGILRRVYKFAAEHGLAEPLAIDLTLEEWAGGTQRFDLVGLYEFDSFVRLMLDQHDREADLIAAASILGMYAGLRAGEATRLTLKDIVVAHDEFFLEIHRGKSDAARRRIPLHLLAPEDLLKQLRDIVTSRRQEFPPNSRLNTIFLFGPKCVRERFHPRGFIDIVIDCIKAAFGPGYVFHSLRHAFASWTFLRLNAIRNPAVLHELFEAHHRSYSLSALSRLASVIPSTAEQDPLPAFHGDLIVLSKIFGHAGLDTLFLHYIHTFSLVQAAVITRLNAITGQRILPGKLLGRIRGLRSRTSQAKLSNHTVRAVCEHLGLDSGASRAVVS